MRKSLKTFEYKLYQCEIVECSWEESPEEEPWLCGYVTLPDGHPDRVNDESLVCDIPCHGGITFADNGVLGFDCHHYGDSRAVQNEDYVESELKDLVDILIKRAE